jgi:hypothetical protein
MRMFYSKIGPAVFLAVLGIFAGVALTGCETVASTSAYYLSYSAKTYPPKAADAPVPILAKAPDEPYRVIGRLAFQTGRGWRFLRDSMLYNARANGADAVILRDTTQKRQYGIVNVPPRLNYVPVPGPVCQNKKGQVYYGTTWIPDFQPGYSYPTSWTIQGIDAEMIVFRK